MLQPGSLSLSWHRMLHAFRSCFTAPSFRTFTALLTGLIAQTSTRTVCGMLTGAGLAGIWHHSRAHWFFAHARWSTTPLGLTALNLITTELLDPDTPLALAIDDTLFRRTGRTIHATGWHHDATSPTHHKNAVAWGNNWIVVGVLVTLPFSTRPVCLPILVTLWTKGTDHKSTCARALITQIAHACPDRPIHLVADAYYATRHWRGLDPRISLTVRLRTNAALYDIHTPQPGVTGRPKHIGDKIGTPTDLTTHTPWRTEVTLTRYGHTTTAETLDYRCLWVGPLRSQHIRVILVRDTPTRRRKRPYDLAILTTDLCSTTEQIITRYAARWAIEVAFRDAKHLTGAGQARNRTEHAVARTVPFALLAQTLVVCWYTRHGHAPGDVTERRRAAPWYNLKTEPSYQDMIVKLRRTLIAARFHPGTTRPPTHQETLAVQLAWADAAA